MSCDHGKLLARPYFSTIALRCLETSFRFVFGVPFPGSRARKLAPPAGFPAQTSIFGVFQFWSPLLAASKTTHRGFQDQIVIVFGTPGRSLALPKTVIPCNTSFKNHVFQVPLITLFSVALSTRVSASGGVLASRNPSGHLFWHVDWGTWSQNSDF